MCGQRAENEKVRGEMEISSDHSWACSPPPTTQQLFCSVLFHETSDGFPSTFWRNKTHAKPLKKESNIVYWVLSVLKLNISVQKLTARAHNR